MTANNETCTLYVSTLGCDQWSGTLPDPEADRSDGPFATLARARDEIRCRSPRVPTRVYMREGVYSLDEPLVFTPADAGTEAALRTNQRCT